MYLVCGEALYDVFLEENAGECETDLSLRAVAGGSPFNVALGLARLNVGTALATDLARDALGERLAALLQSEGVDGRFLRRRASSTALALVAIDASGTPSYSFMGLDKGDYFPDLKDPRASLSDFKGLHIGSVALVMPRCSHALLDVARQLSDQLLISLDPNVRLSVEPDVAKWHSAVDEFRRFSHLIKISEEDIAALYGDAEAEQICEHWLSDRTVIVILTRGASGASIFTQAHGRIDIPPLAVDVVDTIGAGDSFMAGFLTVLAKRKLLTREALQMMDADELIEAADFASATASWTCSRKGPCLPKIEQVANLAPFAG